MKCVASASPVPQTEERRTDLFPHSPHAARAASAVSSGPQPRPRSTTTTMQPPPPQCSPNRDLHSLTAQRIAAGPDSTETYNLDKLWSHFLTVLKHMHLEFDATSFSIESCPCTIRLALATTELMSAASISPPPPPSPTLSGLPSLSAFFWSTEHSAFRVSRSYKLQFLSG